MMHITFGMFSDGADWSQKTASLGEIKVGPLQFLAWLESRLGLDGVSISAPERINEYMEKIRRVNPAWCKASFELDSWSTAKQLLAWRDELFSAGWDGISGSSERLKALAAIEADPGELAPGIPDRMKMILRELPKYRFHDTLILQDSFARLPRLWKAAVTQLRQSGMSVIEPEQTKTCDPAKILLSGTNEFVLAKECVRFLAAGDNRKTAIICEKDSSVLDGVLQRNGIGRVNTVEKSRWRESLQILPLWLETLWKPFNPQRFLELLLLPCSPIPKILSRELIDALQREPGYGGEEWDNAWEKVKSHYVKDGKLDLQNPEFRKIASVWTMLNDGCFYAEESVFANDIVNRCDFLTKRLAVQIEHHPELALVIEHAKTLKKIVSGRGEIKKMELARILDSIISTGTAGEHDDRERTDFAVFSHPGMIDRDFDTVLWWNFTDRRAASRTNWSAVEIAVMPGYNRAAERELDAEAWRNARNHAAKNIIFFVPQKVNGDTAIRHPFGDELQFDQCLKPEQLTDPAGQWSLACRSTMLEKQPLFAPETKAQLETNSICPPRYCSYTRLNTLITCPFQWFMDDYLDLRMPPAMEIPTGARMFGTLAHKVVEKIYKGRETLTVENAHKDAEKILEQLLPSMAAELLIDGRSVERKRICKTLLEAIDVLVAEINNRKLLVKGCEKELRGTFDGIEFIGYSDVYLENAAGEKFVIDMKWSSSSYYEKHFQEDKALQLAVYSRLLDPEDLDVKCAYFLFPRKQFIFDPQKKWNDLWKNAEEAWAQRFAEIHSGKLARGTADEKDLKNSSSALPMTAGCAFCNYAPLCAMMKE